MAAEWVLDASVAAKCLFTEPASDAARALVISSASTIAPDFIFTELASVASKKVKRGETSKHFAMEALVRAPGLLTMVAPSRPLVTRAFEFAVEYGVSAYDGLYLALADTKQMKVITADRRLVARAQLAGRLTGLVAHLGDAQN
jgi:predicted nucleic acid-binding protein